MAMAASTRAFSEADMLLRTRVWGSDFRWVGRENKLVYKRRNVRKKFFGFIRDVSEYVDSERGDEDRRQNETYHFKNCEAHC